MKTLAAFSILILALVFAGCTTEPPVTSWTLSGDFTLDGPAPANTVRIAAFFQPTGANVLVSNVATPAGDGTFTLDIDASALTPLDSHLILVYAFEDTDNSGTYNTGDQRISLEGGTDCPVFGLDHDAAFVYFAAADTGLFGHAAGWNVDEVLDTELSVSVAPLTGAIVRNWTDFL